MTDWDEMAGVWLERPAGGLWRRHSDTLNRGLLERWLPERLDAVLKTDLFDEAVSDGLAGVLGARASRVVGVDLNVEIVEAARRRHPGIEAHVADVRALPFESGSFGAIVSNSTLDHFDHEREITVAVGELARVLRPGGSLVLTLDNPSNPVVALGKALPRKALNRIWRLVGKSTARVGLAPYYMGATLDPRGMRETARAAGLAPGDETTLVHAPRVLAVMIAAALESRSPRVQSRFLTVVAACERLGSTPVGRFTAHANALLAVKPSPGDPSETG